MSLPPHAVADDLRLDLGLLDGRRVADWAAVRADVGYALPDDPAPAGERCILAYRGGRPVARLALGARDDLVGAPGRTGFVGWYEAADRQAGAAALAEAARLLWSEGAHRVLGPLNGSTWARYRLAEPRAEEVEDGRPFLSEPQNPPAYVADFQAAGFRPLLRFETRWVARPEPDAEVERSVWPGLESGDVRIRDLDLARFEEELDGLFRLSTEAFAQNPLFSTISFEEFAAQYTRMRPLLDPRLVRLAAGTAGRLVGYVFAFSDPLAPPDRPRIVLKTLASAPGARGLGLGRALVDDIHREAARRGQGVLHALMHVDNASKRISTRSESALFRRYALFEAARP